LVIGKEAIIMEAKKRVIFSGAFPATVHVLCLFVGIAIFLVSSSANAGSEELYGTWRLVSFKNTVLETGQTTDVFGKSPRGFINYGKDGRMLVLIVSEKRPRVANLAKITDQDRVALLMTMIGYGGTYEYNGKTVTHHIDISCHETWPGADVVREVKLEGDKLILTAVPAPSPIDGKLITGVLTWERIQ
jgi:hypothetical protein